MFYTLGSYQLNINKWESEKEKLTFMEKCNLGNLNLAEALYYNADHFTLTAQIGDGRFGIGISTDYTAIKPSILLDYTQLNIILGYGLSIKAINLPTRKLVFEHNLDTCFYQFISLSHLGIMDYFLVIYETGIVALSYSGLNLWSYDGGDVVVFTELNKDYIVIRLLDNSTQDVYIQLKNGKIA